MIKAREIQQKARADGVRDTQIEKDYVLSWILCGISAHETLAKQLVFKGGTALKKIYFDGYRFSEDLDFTLLTHQQSIESLFKGFNECFFHVKEEANISLSLQADHEQRETGYSFQIQYLGPLGGLGANKTVKVDISKSELLAFPPVLKHAIINYSDLEAYQLLCYSLEEVLVEKLRSVMQRMQARDFYDIWYLLEQHGMDVDFHYPEFCRKCNDKGLNPNNFQRKLSERLDQYKGRWKSSMADQIKDLPDFDKVVRDVQRHLKKLPLH